MKFNWKAIIATAAGVGLAGYGVHKLVSKKKASNEETYVEDDTANEDIDEDEFVADEAE